MAVVQVESLEFASAHWRPFFVPYPQEVEIAYQADPAPGEVAVVRLVLYRVVPGSVPETRVVFERRLEGPTAATFEQVRLEESGEYDLGVWHESASGPGPGWITAQIAYDESQLPFLQRAAAWLGVAAALGLLASQIGRNRHG